MVLDLVALFFSVLAFTLVAFHLRTYSNFTRRVNQWSADADRRIEALKPPSDRLPRKPRGMK